MTEKRFTIKKRGNGLFYSDGDYSIDNTTQFIIETVEFKLNQLNDENKQLKEDNKQYNILVESLKDENQRLKLRLKDLGVEF